MNRDLTYQDLVLQNFCQDAIVNDWEWSWTNATDFFCHDAIVTSFVRLRMGP